MSQRIRHLWFYRFAVIQRHQIVRFVAGLSLVLAVFTTPQSASSASAQTESRYLLFQIFTYPTEEHAGGAYFPPQARMENTSDDIVKRIGTTGDVAHQLGICPGPLTLNQSDKEIRDLIHLSFSIAKSRHIAVAFHIDDQMFWEGRTDLNNKECIEWTGWDGTLCTGRRLDWGPQPAKAPPGLCLNSSGVQSAVKQRAGFIGKEIAAELRSLSAADQEHLFAGVIAGWETMIGRDFATGKKLGYHALKNRGLDANHSQAELDNALVQVVHDHIALWSDSLAAQGIPRSKIYCHIASLGIEQAPTGQTLLEASGYAPVAVAFDKRYRPGFSTYPDFTLINRLEAERAKFGRVPWISAEGTNVVPNGMPGAATMETYLGERFNRGAVAVNIFSWGMGGDAERNNMFRRVTENDEAIGAYRKFLRGAKLVETKREGLSPQQLQAKVHRIQSEVPQWVQRTHRLDIMEPLMQRLDAAIKGGDLYGTNATADEILKILSRP